MRNFLSFTYREPLPDSPVSRCSGRPILWLAAVLLLTSGCASVKPWEHDILASPAMQINDEPMLNGVDDHTYFSREASKGGRGFGGGGCGCN